jgi:N-methylhydantoinase A
VRVAVDTGGTFTDVAIADGSGAVGVWKLPSRPAAPEEAVVAGVKEALERSGARPDQVARFVHGTTVATNALLTREGARVGLVVTAGFRDLLAIGRQDRPSLYDFAARRPRPLVPRRLTFELPERMGPDGEEIEPPADADLEALAAEVRAARCEAVVVSLLNAYANPAHEQAAVAALRAAEVAPWVGAATDVSAEMREFERTSTAVLNAYVLPAIAAYVGRLEEALGAAGIAARLWVMQSNGGLLGAQAARATSVRTILSGPAGGVAAGAGLARELGLEQAVTLDIGGTSTDISLIRDGEPELVTESELEGYALRLPMLGIHTIGAGGGSIAWRDAGGSLRAGPQSAGADPGPACYGAGGEDPTVTDAHLLLGRLGDRLLGGRLALDRERAEAAVGCLASDLGLDPVAAAAGILAVATAAMARGIRKVSVERGVDVRDCALLAFGGAGPLHAAELIGELGMREAVVPPHPGIASAIGMLHADVRHDLAQTVGGRLGDDGFDAAAEAAAALEEQAHGLLRADERLPDDAIGVERAADLRYEGQSYELTIPWAPAEGPGALRDRFEAAHEERYGYRGQASPVELVTVRVSGIGRLPEPAPAAVDGRPAAPPEPAGRRPVHFAGDWHDTPVHRRDDLPVEVTMPGPAVIEQLDSTVVVAPGQAFALDRHGNLRLRPTA